MHSYVRRGWRFLFAGLLILALAPGVGRLALASPLAQVPTEPEISARAGIVVEYPSGRILYSRGAHDRLAPASTTKILTAILAIEYGKVQDIVTVADSDLVGESSMGLVGGEQQTMHELLYGLMLPSGNDAAAAIARSLGEKSTSGDPTLSDPGSRFIAMMNARVTQLGLKNSHFLNPHGLDMPEHYSSAYDLASLSWYAMHLPTFNEVVAQVGHDGPGHALMNTNEMLTRYPGADGIKTGWTDEGGLCLVTSATRDGKRLISVVLNAPQWYTDSAALLDYGFATVASIPVDEAAEILSVSKRGTAGWLLANSDSVQPPPEVAPRGQGGGVAAAVEKSKPVISSAGVGDKIPVHDSQVMRAIETSQDGSAMLWALLAFALVGSTCFYLLATRLLRMRPRYATAGQTSYASRPARTVTPPAPLHARTLGDNMVTRRREPNLLETQADAAVTHLEQAVSLASEGRQGASMAEFVNAMRLGLTIDVAQLAAQYELPSAAFLALARAQMATAAPEEARRTLLHGVLVFPNERLLRLALSQLR